MAFTNVMMVVWILSTFTCITLSVRNSYMLTMLKTIRPGHSTNIWVSILRGRRANINIKLRNANWEMISQVSGTVTSRRPRTFVLKIPKMLGNGPYTVEAIGTGAVSFHHNKTVILSTKSSSILIQTDKRIYKPGQKVLFRCLGIYPNLKLVSGASFDVVIYDSDRNIIKQWIDVTPGPSCVFEGQLQLTEYTNLGEWKVECSQLSATAEKIFDVDEVVFPRFEVTMSVPPVPLTTDDELAIPVSVKYTFGKSVKGTLIMTYTNKFAQNKRITKNFEIDGDLITTISMAQIVPGIGNTLEVTASVTEHLTGLKHSSTEEVNIYRYPETLEFPSSLPKVFKPGLRYFGILRLVQPDGNPVPGAEGKTMNITVTYEVPRMETKIGESDAIEERRVIWPPLPPRDTIKLDPIKIIITSSGIIPFDFILPSIAVSSNIKACYNNVCAYQRLDKAESPSKSYIQLRLISEMKMLKVGKKILFSITSNRYVKQVTFQVVSKRLGTIIGTGVRRNKENKEFQISLKLTHRLTPSFTMVIYFTEGKEVVADSLTLNVKGLMDRHKVKIKFSKSKVKPAETVTLSTNAARCADVHILAVDKRTLLLKTGNDITQNDVVAELQTYGVEDGPVIMPFRWFWFWPRPVNGRDAFSIFQDANIAVITDLTIYKHHEVFPPIVMQRMEVEGIDDFAMAAVNVNRPEQEAKVGGKVRVRKNLPETWLFQTLKAGQRLRLKAPDAITTYIASAFAVCCENNKGLGVAANTASLTVFQKIFVRVTLPYSAIRGEILVVQVDLFNYDNKDAKFFLMIRKSNRNVDFINGNGKRFNPTHPVFKKHWVKEIFVAANKIGTAYFPIKPLKIGDVRVRVDASIAVGDNHRRVDAIQRMLLVKAEGFPQSYNIAMLKKLENGETVTETVNITFPPNVVAGSQNIQVSVIGDILGSALAGIEDLLQMSYGCGEQNLVRFVPNVFITSYLKSTGRLTPKIKADAERFIAAGYQRQLTYKRSDGSFSAFGNSDASGSTWLTALVLKSFAEAKDLVYIDPNVMRDAISWLIQRQNTKSGAFHEPGRVIHKSMQGGSSGSVRSLAAFIAIALIEAKNQDCVPVNMEESVDSAINKTLHLISNAVPGSLESMYEMSIVLYALSLADHPAKDVVFTALDALATEEGGHKYWTLPANQSDALANWEGEWHPPTTQSRGIDIEMTSYVLSSLVIMEDTQNSIKVLKWLTSQQNPNGGFVSTQDTMVALQALTAVAKSMFSDSSSVTVTVSGTNGFSHTFAIDSSNAIVTQIAEVDNRVRSLSIVATGTGICILEVSVRFNIQRELRVPSYWINTTITEETMNGFRLTICVRWLRSGSSTMALLQFEVPTGMDADDSTLDTGKAGTYKRKERNGSTVILYFDSISAEIMCISIYVSRVDLVVNPRPRPCSIIDYYEPSNRMTIEYLPSRIGSSGLGDVCGVRCE